MSQYPYFLGVMATLYIVEPLLTLVYIKNVCIAGEKVCHITGTIQSEQIVWAALGYLQEWSPCSAAILGALH